VARYAFDEDTEVTLVGGAGPRRLYSCHLSDRWAIVGGRPNGGYLMALTARALAASLPHPDPLAVTAHFLASPQSGPARIEVEQARVGRSISTATARLEAGGRDVLRVLASFGDLAARTGLTLVTARPPELPPPDECASRGPTVGGWEMGFAKRFDTRIDPATAGMFQGQPTGRSEVRGWIRFADGRDADPLALIMFGDSLPPTAYNLGVRTWVPTLELTAYVRARPAPGWLRISMVTRNLLDGQLEEDIEVWDSRDRLVLQARQLAWILPG
jgi:hypothetical protein